MNPFASLAAKLNLIDDIQYNETNPNSGSPTSELAFDSTLISKPMYGLERIIGIVYPIVKLLPSLATNLQSSAQLFLSSVKNLPWTLGQTVLAFPGASITTGGELPGLIRRIGRILVSDLPKTVAVLPVQFGKLVTALAKVSPTLPNVGKDFPQTVLNITGVIPRRVFNLYLLTNILRILITDALPKILSVVNGHLTVALHNVTQIKIMAELIVSIVRSLPVTIEETSNIISSVSYDVKRLPSLSSITDDAIAQLSAILTRLPTIISSLPGNIDLTAKTLENLKGVIAKLPLRLRQSLGTVVLVGDKDSEVEMDKWRLRDEIVYDPNRIPSEFQKPTHPLTKSLNNAYSTGAADQIGLDKVIVNLLGSIQTIVTGIYNYQTYDKAILESAKPLIISLKSLLDVTQRLNLVDKLTPRASFDPLLDLVNRLLAN